MELFQGAERSGDPTAAHVRLRVFVEAVPILPFSIPIAERCARLRETLRRAGKQPRRRALDLIIASTALEHGLILVTRNADDYADVPDLELRQP